MTILLAFTIALLALWLGALIGMYHRAKTSAVWIHTFMVNFPGKCPICSFHRYGLANGQTTEPFPQPHDNCIEVQ